MADPRAQFIISADDKASRVFRQVQNNMRGIEVAGRRLITSLAAIGGGLSFVSTVRNVEVLRASLETVTGGSREAASAFADLQKFAAQTPFSLQEVTQAFVRLKALGLEPTTELLTSFGNTASAFGKSLMQFSEAVADAITGEFERLKEFGIRASQQGDKVAFTFRGVTTVVRKQGDEIKRYLEEIGNSDFAGAMEKRAATLDGALSNLGDSFERLLVAVGDSGLTAVIQRVAEFLSNSVQDILDFSAATKNLYSTLFGVNAQLNDLYREQIKLQTELQALEDGPGGGRGLTAQRLDQKLMLVESQIAALEKIARNDDADIGGRRVEPVRIAVTGGTQTPGPTPEELRRLEALANKLQQPYDKLYSSLVDLDTLLARGMITWDEYAEATFDALDGVSNKIDPVKDQFSGLKDAIEGWGRDFADTLLDAGGSMGDFADTVLRQLARIALAKTFDPFFSMFGDWIGGSVGKIFTAATGGPVSSNKTYLVGEQGPELFTPNAAGSIIPNGALGGSGVIVNVHNNATGAQATTREREENGMTVIDVMIEQVKTAIAGDISRGAGAVPNALQGTYGLNRVAGAY